MAKVKLAPAVEAIRGHVGDMLFRHQYDREYVGKMPDFSGVLPTENQTAQREKFRLATVYGKACMANPTTKAQYAAAGDARMIPAFAVAVADFLNAPVVDEIDLSAYTGKIGDTISVRASDDYKVASVGIAIRDQGGSLLESGAAVLGTDGSWDYTTTSALAEGQAVSIEVTATDAPGHKTTRTQARS
jgi:hypothetical protein